MKETHRKILSELTAELAEKKAEFELKKKKPKTVLLISIFTITLIMAVSFLSYQNNNLKEVNQSLEYRYLKASQEWPNPLCKDDIITTIDGEPACPI